MGAMVNLIIGAVIALLPLYSKVGMRDISRVSKDNLLVILMMLFCFLLRKKERQLPIAGYVALIYGLFLLSFNQWQPISLFVQYQTFYVSAGLIFFACFYERHSREGLHYILNGMAVGSLIQSLLVILAEFGLPVYFIVTEYISGGHAVGAGAKGIGSLGQTNLLASYVSLTALSLFRKKWLPLIIFPVIALVIANSVMGYATLLAGALYFANSQIKYFKKHYLYIASSIVMIGTYFTGIGGSDTGRFSAWRKIFSEVDLPHFLFGKGPGWFPDHGIVTDFREFMIQEHNEFISAFNIFGILGLAILIPLAVKFFKQGHKCQIFSSVVFAGFVNSYGHFTHHQSTTALILIVALAVCFSEEENICLRHGTEAR